MSFRSCCRWPPAVDRATFQAELDKLRAREKAHTREGFIYRSTDDTPANEALARWAAEIVPAVREAITG